MAAVRASKTRFKEAPCAASSRIRLSSFKQPPGTLLRLVFPAAIKQLPVGFSPTDRAQHGDDEQRD